MFFLIGVEFSSITKKKPFCGKKKNHFQNGKNTKIFKVAFYFKKSVFLQPQNTRGVAQLVARYVRDVEAGSSSLLTPTKSLKIRIFRLFL